MSLRASNSNHQLVCRGFWEAVFFHGAEILVLMVHRPETYHIGSTTASYQPPSEQRSLDVFCEKEITQTFVGNSESDFAKDSLAIFVAWLSPRSEVFEHPEATEKAGEAFVSSSVDCWLVERRNL